MKSLYYGISAKDPVHADEVVIFINKRIFLSPPHMSDAGYERQFIDEAFQKNYIAPLGENVDAFEAAMLTATGAKAATALSSGTANSQASWRTKSGRRKTLS